MNKEHRESIVQEAGQLFGNGHYHCAETIVAAYLQAREVEDNQLIRCATPFGGGMGKSFEEACGVITGALIAIGHCYGRNIAGENWDLPAQLAEQFRNRFMKTHGTSCCRILRERFGEEQMQECEKLVVEGTRELINLIDHYEKAQTNSSK